MTDIPDWAIDVPSAPGIHSWPEGAGSDLVRPFSVGQLIEFGLELMEQFLRRVVQALFGFFPGGAAAFELLSEWADKLFQRFETIASILGFNSIDDLLGLLNPLNVWQRISEIFIDPLGFFAKIIDIVQALTGLFFGDLQDLAAWASNIPLIGDIVRAVTGFFGGLEDLAAWAAGLPFIGDIVRAVTGFFGGELDLSQWFTNLRRFLGGINFLDPNFDLMAAARRFIEIILLPVNKLAELVGGLIPDRIIPLLNGSKIGSVSLSSIGNWFQNLLSGGLFPWGSLMSSPDWSLDPLGLEGNAATVLADGERHGLSGVVIPVVEGRAVDLEINVEWENLTVSGAGAPIVLSAILLDSNERRIGSFRLDSAGSAGGNSNGWQLLKGQYIPARGVASVRMLVEVMEYALSGVVRFSTASAGKTGLFELDWTAHLVKRWESTATLMGIEDHDLDGDIDLQDVWASLITGKLNPLRLFEDFVGRVFSGSIVDEALEALTGLPIVGGLPKALARELGDLFNTANDAFARAWDFGEDLLELIHGLLTQPAQWIGGMVNDLSTRIRNITTNGLLQASALTGTIANNLIPGLVNLINGLATAPAQWIGGMVNDLSTRIRRLTSTGAFPGEYLTGIISRERIPVLDDMVYAINRTLDLIRDILSFIGLSGIVPPNIE